MPPTHRRSNVRRSNVTACARCKSRKQRCDQNLPACGNCERAGVECVGHDVDGSLVPRSYLKSLEDRVAYLEKQLMSRGIRDYDSPSAEEPQHHAAEPQPALPPVSHHSRAEELLERACYVSLYASSFPNPKYLGTGSGLPLLRLLLVELESKIKLDPHSSAGPHHSLLEDIPYHVSAQLPAPEVSQRLVGAYFEHCDFFSPIIYRSELLEMLERLSAGATAAASSLVEERYRVFMVLGIAIILLNRTDSSIPTARSEAYFSEAFRILLENPSTLLAGDLRHLENLLLVIQYTCFSPTLTGAWHMIGLATRLAVDLGLHDEPGDDLSLDPLTLDKRRRLFWATYTFERNMCAVLGRPVSIPDEAIFASLPAAVDDEYITSTGIAPQSGPSRKAFSIHLVKYRQLESEIMQTLHYKRAPGTVDFDYQTWRQNMHQKLEAWRNAAPRQVSSTQLAPPEMVNGCLYNSLVHVYSPSRHLPRISDGDIVLLAGFASNSIEAYRTGFREGKLRFYWRTVHNLFRSGVSLIYCLKNWPGNRSEANWEELKTAANTCSAVLWGMVERYPAGKPCRDLFETLVSSLQEPHNDHVPPPPANCFSGQTAANFMLSPQAPHNLALHPEDFMIQNVQGSDLFSWDFDPSV